MSGTNGNGQPKRKRGRPPGPCKTPYKRLIPPATVGRPLRLDPDEDRWTPAEFGRLSAYADWPGRLLDQARRGDGMALADLRTEFRCRLLTVEQRCAMTSPSSAWPGAGVP